MADTTLNLGEDIESRGSISYDDKNVEVNEGNVRWSEQATDTLKELLGMKVNHGIYISEKEWSNFPQFRSKQWEEIKWVQYMIWRKRLIVAALCLTVVSCIIQVITASMSWNSKKEIIERCQRGSEFKVVKKNQTGSPIEFFDMDDVYENESENLKISLLALKAPFKSLKAKTIREVSSTNSTNDIPPASLLLNEYFEAAASQGFQFVEIPEDNILSVADGKEKYAHGKCVWDLQNPWYTDIQRTTKKQNRINANIGCNSKTNLQYSRPYRCICSVSTFKVFNKYDFLDIDTSTNGTNYRIKDNLGNIKTSQRSLELRMPDELCMSIPSVKASLVDFQSKHINSFANLNLTSDHEIEKILKNRTSSTLSKMVLKQLAELENYEYEISTGDREYENPLLASIEKVEGSTYFHQEICQVQVGDKAFNGTLRTVGTYVTCFYSPDGHYFEEYEDVPVTTRECCSPSEYVFTYAFQQNGSIKRWIYDSFVIFIQVIISVIYLVTCGLFLHKYSNNFAFSSRLVFCAWLTPFLLKFLQFSIPVIKIWEFNSTNTAIQTATYAICCTYMLT